VFDKLLESCISEEELELSATKKFELDTKDHVNKVRNLIDKVCSELSKRASEHDASKFGKAEASSFAEITPKLKSTVYGSDEYKANLKSIQPAIDHHYSVNRHHPEHFENGIQGMNLVDITEMICDWCAASARGMGGDIEKSIEINQKRFGFSDDLKQIFMNTVKFLEG